jgi:hypothetical protein
MSTLYPTPEHEQAANAVIAYFSEQKATEAVTLTCSCARGKASSDSDLDLEVFLSPENFANRDGLEQNWNAYASSEPSFLALQQHGIFCAVDVSFTSTSFVPELRGWTSGPDAFELKIGNSVAYAVPLWEKADAFQNLKAQWLPYYAETLRHKKLEEVLMYCHNNLAHIPPYVERELYFQCFKRLYDASKEFLQALFISRGTYPIAYDKWVKEQLVDILGLPEVYSHFVELYEVCPFNGQTLSAKMKQLEKLIDTYIT